MYVFWVNMCDSQQIVGAVQVRWLYISWGEIKQHQRTW